MPTTTNVDFTASVRGIGARTNSAGAAVADYSAEEDRLAQAILTEGKLTDTAFKVNAGAGMQVLVGTTAKVDLCVVQGEIAGQGQYLVRLDGPPVAVALTAADPAQARTDEIYLVVRDIPYDGGTVSLPRIGYRRGDVGAGNPGPDASWKASVLLARVNIPAAALAPGTITDQRVNASLAPSIMAAITSQITPPGVSMEYWGSVAPSGWLIEDNSEQPIATYPALYSVLTAGGTVFPHGPNTNGAGAAGSTHFRLPAHRGRVGVGVDTTQTEFNTLGKTGGAKTHTLTPGEMPAHSHTIDHDHGGTENTGLNVGSHTHDVPIWTSGNESLGFGLGPSASFTDRVMISGGPLNTGAQEVASNHGHTFNVPAHAGSSGSAGADGAHNNLQPYIALNYIIKT